MIKQNDHSQQSNECDNMTNTTITNDTIKKIDHLNDVHLYQYEHETFLQNIHEHEYNEHEKKLFHHFIKLYDEKQFYQFVIDFLYILKLYDEHIKKNSFLKTNHFFHDFYVLHHIYFYHDIKYIIFSNMMQFDQNDSFDSCDHDMIKMQFDQNGQCDELFNNIVNN